MTTRRRTERTAHTARCVFLPLLAVALIWLFLAATSTWLTEHHAVVHVRRFLEARSAGK